MKISAYTTDEINMLKEKCNFSPSEMKIFELKAKDYSNVQIAMTMGMSESSLAIANRRIREKVTFVMERHVQEMRSSAQSVGCDGCRSRVYHTMAEWSRIPDFLSGKGVEYVYGDYRTEIINGIEVNIPRIKYGDGIHSVSELPFATMSITESDMERWDNKPDMENNDFGKTIIIDDRYTKDNKFVFPSDGYVTLSFNSNDEGEAAEVEIYGASEKFGFTLRKCADIDRQSKEVFVRKGMKCVFMMATEKAEIKFYPLM